MDDRHELPSPAEIARGHAVADWGVPASEIAIEAVEAVDWPDASLGAPEPDMLYAQIITPGYRVRLQAGRRFRVYHTDRDARIVLVEDTSTDE